MKTILLVDDSTFTRNSLRKTLLDKGLNILQGSNGMEAIEILKNNSIDLIVTDLNMPEMDGLGLLERLKANNHKIPVLVFTADIQDTTREHCMNLGARDVIHKQFNQKLLSNIESILNEDVS